MTVYQDGEDGLGTRGSVGENGKLPGADDRSGGDQGWTTEVDGVEVPDQAMGERGVVVLVGERTRLRGVDVWTRGGRASRSYRRESEDPHPSGTTSGGSTYVDSQQPASGTPTNSPWGYS